MKKLATTAVLPVLLGFLLSGCYLPNGGSMNDPEELARLAVSAAELGEIRLLAAAGKLEVEDLEKSGEPVSSKTLFADEWRKVLPDGTVVSWVHVLDDRNTPGDPEDDTITVTRSYDVWNGEAEKTERIIRPRKPEADWSSWENERLVQTGSVDLFIEGILVRRGTITVAWERRGGEVFLSEVVKESYRPDRSGCIERILVVVDDQGLQTKTQFRIRCTRDGEVIVHSFVFEEFVEDGERFLRIIRDDGRYCIVREAGNPRITERYDPDGRLVVRVTERRDGKILDVRKEFFDRDGNLVATRHASVVYRFLGDRVIITRTFDDGRAHTVSIVETDDGYRINRNGVEYTVTLIDGGVAFTDGGGNRTATVLFNSDGSFTVLKPDGSEARLVI